MKKIYVVVGETGEYEDKRKWIVALYTDKNECIKHIEAANKVSSDYFKLHTKGDGVSMAWQACDKCENPYDPMMKIDTNGTWYYYVISELMEKFD